jgi:hypothetical protein
VFNIAQALIEIPGNGFENANLFDWHKDRGNLPGNINGGRAFKLSCKK